MKKSILFISCEEAHHICDKSQYGEATGWERVKLGIRLCWCKVTKAYTKKNNKLTDVINNSKIDCLIDSEVKKIKQSFEKELSN